jgi:hypothetical protein
LLGPLPPAVLRKLLILQIAELHVKAPDASGTLIN